MILYILMFLAWGSYLNSLAYRLLNLEYFHKYRSFCTTCKTNIKWYDNIPIFSWLWLQGQCRWCQQTISWLYPFIEIYTTITFILLYQKIPSYYFYTYFIICSALIVTIRTDIESLLISRFVTLYLIPFAYYGAFYHYLPISLMDSIAGSLFGYSLLSVTRTINFLITKKDGMGQGDLELLAFIGSFSGIIGCWVSLTLGSIVGTVITLCLKNIQKKPMLYIPFGAYLSSSAILYILYQNHFIHYFS